MKLRRISQSELVDTGAEGISVLENKYLLHLESLFLQAFIWSFGTFSLAFDNANNFNLSVLDKIKKYRKSLDFRFKFPFGNNFFELITSGLTVFDIFFDITNERWSSISNIIYIKRY